MRTHRETRHGARHSGQDRPPHRRRRSGAAWAVLALALAAALALTGCGGAARSSDASADSGAKDDKAAVAPAPARQDAEGAPGAAAPAPSAPADQAKQPVTVRPQVIRTATLAIETAQAQRALAGARSAAEGAGGFVGAESTRREADGALTSTMTLRVPAERFDAVLTALEGAGTLRGRTVEAVDVTQKVADVDSRVKSQQASVVRVREMMEKASALSDVVLLEGELSRRQSDLESLLAQQTALKDQTTLGTITLQVAQPRQAAGAGNADRAGFTDALGGGWSVFTTVLRWLVLALGAVLPFAAAAALVVLGLRVLRRLRAPAPGAAPSPEARDAVDTGAGDAADPQARVAG
ncbi:DUF4349 domain-containing protein [Streptomyces sp. NPDC006529]|uniref:DUF4349 domain-containing protein n=1 Tax=Streptomyces sp. NPDC006529 TaxID=3157177 RepID=UPI0033BABB47